MMNALNAITMRFGYKVISSAIYAAGYLEKTAGTPTQRNVMLASAATTMALLSLVPVAAHASGGFAGMMDTAAEQSDSMQRSFQRIAAAAGVVAVGFGLFRWWRKSQEGDHSPIKTSHILVPIVAGAALGALSFVLSKAGETIGIQNSDRASVSAL